MFKNVKNKVKDLDLKNAFRKLEIEDVKKDIKELKRRVYINEHPFKIDQHTKVYGLRGTVSKLHWGSWAHACPEGHEGKGYVIQLKRTDNSDGYPEPRYMVYMIGRGCYECRYEELILEQQA